jgi:hypothetical protein
MGYTTKQFEEAVAHHGEVWFVLDSDREYEIHGRRDYTFTERDGRTFVETDGMNGGERLLVEFPLDTIEHHYSHDEI